MQFDRTWRLVVGKAGGQGRAIEPPLKISFEIEKDPAENPNYTKVKVWNLAAPTRAALMTPDHFVALYAGYKQGAGALLMSSGNIADAWTVWDGTDVVTEVAYLEGNVEYRDTVVTLGYGQGVSARTVIGEIAQQMGLALYMPDGAPDRTWQHGFSYAGAARTALHKAVQGTGLEWSIQNGTLQVIARGGTTTRQGVVLSAGSGLIGSPERLLQSAKELIKVNDTAGKQKRLDRRQKRTGWKVEALLLPQVVPGDRVRLESRTVTGWFRADSVKHSGDSHGPDWKTILELVDPSSPAPTPPKK